MWEWLTNLFDQGNLHSEQGKDEDEEEEEKEQGEDGPHRVEQRDDQVAKARPVLRHLDVVGNHRMFFSPWSHLEDPQESEGTKDGEAKLSGLWPLQRSFLSTLFYLYKVSV